MFVGKRQNKSYVLIICVFLLLSLLASACSNSGTPSDTKDDQDFETIRIAKQFGLVYAPLMVSEKKDFFERYGLRVEWKTLGSGGSVREIMAAGEIDAAFMGIPPFLIGWDKGLEAKIASGYCSVPISLITYDEDINSLSDFGPEHQIALPSPGSVQHILLAMALEKQLGDPNILDDNLVALPHPDGAQALLSKKDIVAHFTTPPYIFEELAQPGYKTVVDAYEAFGGDFNFNVGLVTNKYYVEHPKGYAAFIMGLNDAVNWVNENKEETAKLLAPEFEIEEERLLEYLTKEDMNYTTAPYGLMGFADFMKKAGYISKVPERISEIAWENVLAQIGEKEGSRSSMERLQYPE